MAQRVHHQWRSHREHPIDPDDLVTAGEIAVRLGLRDVRRVWDWSLLGDFPPVVARARHRYWYWPEVDLWAAERHPELRSPAVAVSEVTP